MIIYISTCLKYVHTRGDTELDSYKNKYVYLDIRIKLAIDLFTLDDQTHFNAST